ncbi:hypothetical protein GCM10009117_10380 [Gangjinia marincola]|uniref:Secretion system C-terminal sorting domain-containing protein n=1 Tax=Gangjinia marincola TaxID=578463 RepID=A0ABN1MFF1_9FLAO
MIKKIHLLLVLVTSISFAQIPVDYYDSADGLEGYALKTALRNIIANGHVAQSYGDLYDGYVLTHSDFYYEDDSTVLDYYSEDPNTTDPYNYTHGSDQCGNQNSEGDCYNREHLMPQSVFDSDFPMQSDIHHVVPSDGRVNNFRGSLPFGNVASANWTSLNGSKRGTSSDDYNGDVFEPIDEFKGEIARAMLYFATRYENQVSSWSHPMLNGTNDQVYEDWFVDVLVQWHNDDPVNQSELDRNDAAYDFQGNANPFVDHPEYVNMIWAPELSAPSSSIGRKEVVFYPNPVKVNTLTFDFPESSKAVVSFYDVLGKKVLIRQMSNIKNVLDISPLTAGVYLVKIDQAGVTSTLKLVRE